MVKLGEVVSDNKFAIVDGPFGTQLHASDYTESGIPVIRITNITRSNSFDDKNLVYISEQKYNELKRSSVSTGDILLAKTGATIGKVAIFDGNDKGIIASSCAKISINPNKANNKWVLFYLSTQEGQTQIISGSSGSTRNSINLKQIANVKIPLPPLPTQHKIVDILEGADNLRKLRKQADEKMKDLIPSLFVQMFGDPATNPKKWEIKRLEEVCTKITDGAHVTPTYVNEGIPFLRVTDIQGANIDWNNVKRIPEHEYLEMTKRTCPEKNDILYSKNGTIGIAKMITWDIKFCHFVSLALLKPDRLKLHSKYFEAFLNTPLALKQATDRSKQGTVTNLHLNEIKKIKIPLPPPPLQQEFAKLIEDMEAEKVRQAESKKKLDELFNSLMQRAFAGELVA